LECIFLPGDGLACASDLKTCACSSPSVGRLIYARLISMKLADKWGYHGHGADDHIPIKKNKKIKNML